MAIDRLALEDRGYNLLPNKPSKLTGECRRRAARDYRGHPQLNGKALARHAAKQAAGSESRTRSGRLSNNEDSRRKIRQRLRPRTALGAGRKHESAAGIGA